jgi:hypothetical protein
MALLRAGLYPTSQMKTQVLLEMLLDGVDTETATTLTDGPDGWTILEIICHLRDFELIWQQRMRLVIAENNAPLPSFDHETLAIQNDYKNQDYATVWAERIALRAESQALIESISGDTWDRTGLHPEFGPLALAEIRFQIVLHDIDHLEQIARVLGKV